VENLCKNHKDRNIFSKDIGKMVPLFRVSDSMDLTVITLNLAQIFFTRIYVFLCLLFKYPSSMKNGLYGTTHSTIHSQRPVYM